MVFYIIILYYSSSFRDSHRGSLKLANKHISDIITLNFTIPKYSQCQ